MRGHIYGGGALLLLVGLMVGAVVCYGIHNMPDTGPLRLPPVTMGDRISRGGTP